MRVDFEREAQFDIYIHAAYSTEALFYRCGYPRHTSSIILWFATAVATSMRTVTMNATVTSVPDPETTTTDYPKGRETLQNLKERAFWKKTRQ